LRIGVSELSFKKRAFSLALKYSDTLKLVEFNILHEITIEIKKVKMVFFLPPSLSSLFFYWQLEEAGYHGDGATYRGGIAPEHLPEIQDALKWKDWIWYYYGRDAEDRYIRDWGRK
jgi:hypothetical protein